MSDPEPLDSPEPGGTDVLLDERTSPLDVDAGDHERFAHYVRREKIVEASVMGTPLVALCGKVWVPTRDPQRFPVCPQCKEIFESLPGGDGAGDGGQEP